MILSVELINFRSHKHKKINLDKNFTYITGKNGSGKTSILEAINYVATTKSHRTNNDLDVIKRGESFAKIVVKTKDDLFELVISEKGKIASLNKVEVRKLSDFLSKIKVVFFAPEDLNLIKGSPSVRRSFINIELTKINEAYLNNLTKYNELLKQRNALLKNINIDDDLTFLNILSDSLYEVGSKIIKQREKFLKTLNDYLINSYKMFNSSLVNIKYEPSLNIDEFKNHLINNQKIDILYETTTKGPHRDDFLINYENSDAKNASQGEQRLIVIALKFALVNLIKKSLNEDVVLLLDDVLSELDNLKQKTILKNIPKDIQVIMNSAININSEKILVITLEGDKDE